MLKAKKYDIATTNLANFGSELEKNIKVAAAKTDPAWKKIGQAPGLEVWRIEKFNVKKWADVGSFYSGDSYIVLHTYKKKDALAWDVHFWLGASTTQDEAGTAAYKTVELDDVLGGTPVQHREVEAHESQRFLSYFAKQGGVRILDGGIESGFNHVKPEEYQPRLLWVKGRRNVRVTQVPLAVKSLNDGDVFILDMGLDLYQWQGRKAGPSEKAKAGQLCRAIDDERAGKPEVHVFHQTDKDIPDVFWKTLGGKAAIPSGDGVAGDAEWEKQNAKSLWRLSDKTGKMKFTLESKGNTPRAKLDSKDVFILDASCEVFVWVGKGASAAEKRAGLQAAQNYLTAEKKPVWTPITRILEGGENEVFQSYLD